MKKSINKQSFDYSPIALRKLARHKFAPPTKYFPDRKKASERSACRQRNTNY